MEKIRIVISGAGLRARWVIKNLLRDSNRGVEIAGVYDPDTGVAQEALTQEEWWNSPETKICQSWEEALALPNVPWAMIFSPNAFHREQIEKALAAGKNVFSEKPLATTIEDCQDIYELWRKSGKVFATGFVLRYSLLYRKAFELLADGSFGKIISIEGNENVAPEHGGYIMSNWRRHSKLAGPHILEKCCHDLDLIEWFAGALPSRVAAFHGRDFFTAANRDAMEGKYGLKTFRQWWDPHQTETPFTEDTDLQDNLISIAEFRNHVRVAFSCTMSNAIPERRLRFNCSEGNLEVELYSSTIRYRRLGEMLTTTQSFSGMDGHAGGDDILMKEFWETMRDGVPPKCSGAEGLRSAVYALALDRAAATGSVIDLEPVWKKLGC